MKLLGATVVPVTFGLKTLKEAVDSAFIAYLKDYTNAIYCIPWSVPVLRHRKVLGHMRSAGGA